MNTASQSTPGVRPRKTLADYRMLGCIALAAGSLFVSSADAQVVIDNFNSVGSNRGYFGDWDANNSPVANGMLSIGSGVGTTGSPTTSGGEYAYGLAIDISRQIALQITGMQNTGNQAVQIQIILTDDTSHGNGFSNTQARFRFNFTDIGTSPTTLTLNYAQADYYYYTSTGNYAENAVSQSNFDFADVTSLNVQGDFSGQTLRFSLDEVRAVPEPSTWMMSAALGVVGVLGLMRRARAGR